MKTDIVPINKQNHYFTTSHKVAHIVDEMAKLGVSREALLNNTGLSGEDVFNDLGLVSFSQSIRLIKNALHLTDVKGLGLHIGACENTSSYGLMGYAMSCAPTMKLAAQIAIKYQKASPNLMDMSLQHSQSESHIVLTAPCEVGDEIIFLVEEIFTAIQRSFQLLAGKDIHPLAMYFSYPEPAYSHLYKEAFHCPLYFNASENKISYPQKVLDIPTLQGNVVAQKVANALCEQYITQHHVCDDILQQVRSILMNSPGTFPNEESVAQKMNIHPRNLRRQLKSSDTSFQKIFDSVREQLAIEYLQKSNMALEDIAQLVGFSDSSNFRRAFKRWTGKVPSRYRQGNGLSD